MEVLILTRKEIRDLLPMAECIEVMERAMVATAEGRTRQPLRTGMVLPAPIEGLLGWMPGSMEAPDCFGAKVVSVFPGNFAAGYPSHQGVVLLFETVHGRLISILDGGEITAVRTAAASALATRVLARAEARDLAILGYGEQAEKHLEAMICVRPIDRVRVWGRSRERAHEFAAEQSDRRGIAIEACSSAEEAVRDAEIICTTTAATEPVLEGAWLAPGCHLNAVGSSVPSAREIDTEAVVRCRMYVDLKESTLAQGGELLEAKRSGTATDAHILGEIGEVLVGKVEGRLGPRDRTLYKSLGIVAEDLSSAHHAYEKAKRLGSGTTLEM